MPPSRQGALPTGWLAFAGRELNPLDRVERFPNVDVHSPLLSFPVARVVYAKEPFAGPRQVLRYLSRYTHRIAIANRRLVAADHKGVTFKYKDYRIEGPARYKAMTLATDEFIRRFLIHVLPKGFHRIRHYGLLANGTRAANIAHARQAARSAGAP